MRERREETTKVDQDTSTKGGLLLRSGLDRSLGDY